MTIEITTAMLTWLVVFLCVVNMGGTIWLLHFWWMFKHLIDAHNELAEAVNEDEPSEQEVPTRVVGFNKREGDV